MRNACLCVLTLCVSLPGQQLRGFEVASVKQRPPHSDVRVIGGSPSGARLRLEAMSLADLTAWAYGLKPWQVSGGPKWAGAHDDRLTLDEATSRFDIDAKAEGDATRPVSEFREMLQALLIERFHLTTHRETKEMPVYVLLPDKAGLKIHESAPDAPGVMRMAGGGKIVAKGSTIPQLLGWFSMANGVERPIIDRTGLTSKYDFTLEWSNTLASGTVDQNGPSIFTALREQLGLRLEPQRAPLEFTVIDNAELPQEN